MQLLDENSTISTREIARRVGISKWVPAFCDGTLIEKGFVSFKNFQNQKIRQIISMN